ncbi:methyltransferase, FxLD system [Spongiactinospora rosea]|uniref:Protein-L-isoaspartate O-methyltransferase n=2 Tax=Spongiactinospora rosea TaxID=2248750 RepID=A0A366M4L2_9ACTN|nr:methyltransferase, FxLD system [Spongiactinospora rosea]
MRRLMSADATQRETAEPGWSERVAAFEDAGRGLARLAAGGRLTRGLRQVLAHHAIFAFNRASVPVAEQAAAAWLGRYAAFGGDTDMSAPRSSLATPFTRMESTITTTADPTQLREAMVARFTTSGHLRTPAITQAFRDVERHRFIPDADVYSAYADDAVPIKHDPGGEMISCISAPSIVAIQLEQLDARPGHKVLEGGAATGYNATLLGRLVAPGGHVWTVDVDADLVGTARRHVIEAGIRNVDVVLADAAAGLPQHAPFDRIQFTVGAGDVPLTVLGQLAPGGRMVLPMRIRGSISRSFAFEDNGDGTWRTVSCEMATFIPLRKGIGDDLYIRIPITGEGNVRLETFSEQLVDRAAMPAILDAPIRSIYTGVKFRQGSNWEWLYLWLACVLPNGLSRMPGRRPGFDPHFGWGSMAALDGEHLAYLTVREGEDDQGRFWEIGVIGHGIHPALLAEQVVEAIREWDRDHGGQAPPPTFRMATSSARDLLKADDPRFVIDKTNSRLVVDWP